MKILISCIFLLFMLMADEEFPKLYSMIGDKIYENAQGFTTLVDNENFKNEDKELRYFINKSQKLKELGYKADLQNTTKLRTKYIKELRSLQKLNIELTNKIVTHLQELFKDKKYLYLASLHKNRASDIRKSNVVKTAFALTTDKKNISDDVLYLSKLQSSFNTYKSQLLQARDAQNATECMNDITALYHYFIELELSVENDTCKGFYESYKQMNIYLKEIKVTCNNKSEYIKESELIANRYRKSICI